MGIFKYIWNALFNKAKNEENIKKLILEDELRNKEIQKDKQQVNTEILESKKTIKEVIKVVDKIEDSKNKTKKKRKRYPIGQKTKAKIREYIIENGSIDTITCQKEFKVKSLHNFIWDLRKDGLVFKTEKINFETQSGKNKKVINYILVI